jgi:hypothetical protein
MRVLLGNRHDHSCYRRRLDLRHAAHPSGVTEVVIHVGPLRRIVRRTVGFCADFKIRIVSFVILVVAEPPATPVTQGGAGSTSGHGPPGRFCLRPHRPARRFLPAWRMSKVGTIAALSDFGADPCYGWPADVVTTKRFGVSVFCTPFRCLEAPGNARLTVAALEGPKISWARGRAHVGGAFIGNAKS